MSYSTCITCHRVVRDTDDPTGSPRGTPLVLPSHGCPDPRGTWPWNDGQHYWDDDVRDYRRLSGHDPGDEDVQR